MSTVANGLVERAKLSGPSTAASNEPKSELDSVIKELNRMKEFVERCPDVVGRLFTGYECSKKKQKKERYKIQKVLTKEVIALV